MTNYFIPVSLSHSIPNWVGWIGFAITDIGLIVSLVGLITTYKQTRDAKRAALDAKDYAGQAIDRLRVKNLTGNLSAIIPQIELVREYIMSNNLQARASFSGHVRTIRDVFYNLNISLQKETFGSQDALDATLKEISVLS